MAEFCGGCARAGMPGGDFTGWLTGAPGAEWWLCEGCGWHRFDDAGQPACAPGGRSVPTARDQACPRCLGTRHDEQEPPTGLTPGGVPFARVVLS